MKLKKLLSVAILLASALGVNAQTDVTDTYLVNADFETSPICFTVANNGSINTESVRIGSAGWVYTVPGWGNASVVKNNAVQIATAEYGLSNSSANGLNSTCPPTSDNNGNPGVALHMSAGWGDDAVVTQESKTELAPGVYKFTYFVYNQNSNNNVAVNFTGVSLADGTSYTGTLKTAPQGEWVSETITFAVTTSQNATFSLGFTTSTSGSGDGAKLYIDGITLTYASFGDVEEPALDKRTDIGGVTVDLNDFNVGAEDYTLDVQGTVGEEINIAAENITYTPTVNGLVRFVKHNSVVYVYEGAEFKGLVPSVKAAYTYANSLTTNDPETNNLLQNPSFETLGSLKSGSKYNIGEPWKWNLVNVGDIRIDYNTGKAKHGVSVLVWRGSGNDSYFSQEVASIKPYKGYKVYVSQVASGNANADFIVGLGNTAGGYANSSKNERFGTNQDKIHEIELVNNSVSGGFFTFRNTSNNTANDGQDPVSQIDWVGMVASDAFAITGVTSAEVLYGTAYAPVAVDDAKVALLAKIEEATTITTNRTNVGTGAFQIPESAVEILNGAIEEAQSAYNNASTVADVESATNTLNEAITAYKNTKLNTPAADTRYAIQTAANWIDFNRNSADWDYIQDTYLTYLAGDRNDQGGYNIKLGYAKNANYAQAFGFESVDGVNNGYKIYQIDIDGSKRYLCTGTPYGGTPLQIRTTTSAGDALVFQVVVTEKEGVYNLYNTERGINLSPQDAGAYCSTDHPEMCDFKFVEASKAEVSGSLAAGKYATRIFPFIPELPGGVKVYTVGGVESNYITLEEVANPTANVPYILYNETEGTIDITLSGYGLATENEYANASKNLTGTYLATATTVPAESYVLQTENNGEQQFRTVETETEIIMPYRAYLTVPSAGVKAFFFGGETTGIEAIDAITSGNVEAIYTVNGAKVNSLQKGMNIVKMSNGKVQKVLVK